MRKLSLWVSTDDLKYLIKLTDPLNTGSPRIQLLSMLLERQKMMQEYLQQAQFTISNFFYATLNAMNRHLGNQKEMISKNLE